MTVAAVAAYLQRLCATGYVYAQIEPTNACNTHCAMCPRQSMTRPIQTMNWPVFERTMELILPTPLPMVSFVGFGEPTMHKQLDQMVRFVRDRRPDIIIKVTTNGHRLDADRVARLYDAGLDLLEISVVGTSAEEYSAVMGLPFARVRDLIATLNGAGRPYSLTTFAMHEGEQDTTRRFWTNVGARAIAIKGFHRRGGYLDNNPVGSNAALGDYRPRDSTPGQCHKLMMFLHINVNGHVIPCVQDINDANLLCHHDEIESLEHLVALTKGMAPTFDICCQCEMRRQDLVEYYARFFLERFSDRLPSFIHRLEAMVVPDAG